MREKPANALRETASQTAGPYVHIGLIPAVAGLDRAFPALGVDIAGPYAKGERICIEGVIKDGAGEIVKDAVLEFWQANADGIYADRDAPVEPGFRGWGRAHSDFETGLWRVETIKPGPTPGSGDIQQAPHLLVWIVARGINLGLFTRIYFDDEKAANAADPVLSSVDMTRQATLIAERQNSDGVVFYRFDIVLQGDSETVFFDV